MSCSGCLTGSVFSNTASSRLKIAAFAPIPRARDSTAIAVNPGFLIKTRTEYRTSPIRYSYLNATIGSTFSFTFETSASPVDQCLSDHRLRLDTDFAWTPTSPGHRLRPDTDFAWTPTSPGHRPRPDTDFAWTPTSPEHRLRLDTGFAWTATLPWIRIGRYRPVSHLHRVPLQTSFSIRHTVAAVCGTSVATR